MKDKYIKYFFFLFSVLLIARLRFWGTNVAEGKAGEFSILVYFTRVIPFLSIFLIIGIIDIRRKLKALRQIFSNPFFLSLFIYISVSIFNCAFIAKSNYSLWRTLEIFIILYLAAAMYSVNLSAIEKQQLLYKYIRLILILLIIALISSFIFPSAGWNHYQLFGVYPSINANTLGFLTLGMLYYIIIVSPWKKNQRIPMIALLIFMFIAAKSRTSFIACLFVISLYLLGQLLRFIFYNRIKKNIVIVSFFVSGIVIPGLVLAAPTVYEFVTKGQDKEALTEMSGRIFKWTHATFSIKDRPLFGYGLVAETREMALKYKNVLEHKTYGGGYGNVHNFVLEALLASGFLGAGSYILIFYSFCFIAIFYFVKLTMNNSKDSIYIFSSAFLTTMIFRSFTGSNLAYNGWEYSILLFIYSIKAFPWQKEKTKNIS